MKNNQPIPDWLFEYVQAARDIYGITGPDWAIRSKVSDRPNGKDVSGSTITDARYMNANIVFSTDLEEGDRAREVVIHEIGHVAMFEIDGAFESLLAQVDEARREFLREVFEDAEERFLQRLSRSFVYYIQPKLEPKAEEE